jgi:hypothetical protein
MSNIEDKAQKITALVSESLNDFMNRSDRSVQSDQGILGPSDIGFCRQRAVLMTKGVKPTDKTEKWAAAVGTAIHNYVEEALKKSHPDWILGSIDNLTVTAEFTSGVKISGHPDIVVPSANAVLDIKTVDGFEWVKREGTSKAHDFQRHIYALGCVQNGVLDGDKPVYVGNVYFDRSGKISEPYVLIQEYDARVIQEADDWIGDVIYAVKNDEDASRDIPSPVCERICPFFSVCRGSLEDSDPTEFITNPELLSAIDMYVEARDISKNAEAMKKEAQIRLAGISGSTGEWQVRWVEVAATRVESFDKAAYSRMDIRRVRK